MPPVSVASAQLCPSALAAAIQFVFFFAESTTTRNHNPPRAGNPLNESQATTAGISEDLGHGVLYSGAATQEFCALVLGEHCALSFIDSAV